MAIERSNSPCLHCQLWNPQSLKMIFEIELPLENSIVRRLASSSTILSIILFCSATSHQIKVYLLCIDWLKLYSEIKIPKKIKKPVAIPMWTIFLKYNWSAFKMKIHLYELENYLQGRHLYCGLGPTHWFKCRGRSWQPSNQIKISCHVTRSSLGIGHNGSTVLNQ